jgi:hypothetical protein
MKKADLRRRTAQLHLFAVACWHRLQLARTLGQTALTCDDARTLKFTLIVQGMPMSGRPFLPVRVEDLDEKEAVLAAHREACLRSRTSTDTVPTGRHCCKLLPKCEGSRCRRC